VDTETLSQQLQELVQIGLGVHPATVKVVKRDHVLHILIRYPDTATHRDPLILKTLKDCIEQMKFPIDVSTITIAGCLPGENTYRWIHNLAVNVSDFPPVPQKLVLDQQEASFFSSPVNEQLRQISSEKVAEKTSEKQTLALYIVIWCAVIFIGISSIARLVFRWKEITNALNQLWDLESPLTSGRIQTPHSDEDPLTQEPSQRTVTLPSLIPSPAPLRTADPSQLGESLLQTNSTPAQEGCSITITKDNAETYLSTFVQNQNWIQAICVTNQMMTLFPNNQQELELYRQRLSRLARGQQPPLSVSPSTPSQRSSDASQLGKVALSPTETVRGSRPSVAARADVDWGPYLARLQRLSLIHISEPTRH